MRLIVLQMVVDAKLYNLDFPERRVTGTEKCKVHEASCLQYVCKTVLSWNHIGIQSERLSSVANILMKNFGLSLT